MSGRMTVWWRDLGGAIRVHHCLVPRAEQDEMRRAARVDVHWNHRDVAAIVHVTAGWV